MSGKVLPRIVGLAGIAWGATLLARGDDVWRRMGKRPPTDDEQLVTGILGARHVLQGAVQVLAPRRTSVPAALVDVGHAASMVALAAREPRYRRPALVSGAFSLASGTLTVWSRAAARRGSP